MWLLLPLCILSAWAQKPVTIEPWIAASAPVFYFHSQEKFGPMAPEKFLDQAHMEPNLPFPKTRDDFRALPETSTIVSVPTPLVSIVDSEPALFWIESNSPIIQHFPASEWRLIEYWIHLPYNETGLWFGFGNHQGDWEGIAALFKNNSIVAIYASQHDGGSWYCKSELDAIGTHPVLYSALGTHATYHRPRRFLRNFFGIASDYTEKGVLYDGSKSLRTLDEQNYSEFRGRWGSDAFWHWNRGPFLPNRQTKFLPRTTDKTELKSMADEIKKHCI